MAAEYYKFDVGNLPDELFQPNVPVEKWLQTTTTAGKDGFAESSLRQQQEIPWQVEIERICGIALYMIYNVLPFLLPGLLLASYFSLIARYILYFLVGYCSVLFGIEHFYFRPYFLQKYNRGNGTMKSDMKDNQYLFTERNTSKYLSVQFVWPKSLQYPKMKQKPLIFCVVPHGVAPLGITAYPLWSKLFNDELCHWTCAPIVLKLPLVNFFMRKLGYVAAKSKNILEVLQKKNENIGVILDGIYGMFQTSAEEEIAFLQARKGIVKIALKAGSPIVPVFGFGHTSLYTLTVDPFGILKSLSIALDTSFTPFFGRFGWFLGPPRRTPVTVCLGNPVLCPQIDDPTQEDIDKYHGYMLDAFQEVFDTHKKAYGWNDKELKII